MTSEDIVDDVPVSGSEALFTALQTSDTLNGKLQMLRQHKVLCDVMFRVLDDVEIWAHKSVLCCYSSQAAQMFMNDPTPAIVEIEMKHIPSFILENIINYMYGEELQITPENVQNVYQAASILKIPDVTSVCLQLKADLEIDKENTDVVDVPEEVEDDSITVDEGDIYQQEDIQHVQMTQEELNALVLQSSAEDGQPLVTLTGTEHIEIPTNEDGTPKHILVVQNDDQQEQHIELKVLGPSQHLCGVCNKVFPTLTRLKRHTLTHTKLKAFQCPECKKHFSYKHHIKSHYLAMHTHHRNYRCEKCNIDFPSSSYLSCHNSKVHMPKKCPRCSKVLLDRAAYMRHKTMHSVAYKSECSECQMKFMTKLKLAEHMKQIHNIEIKIPPRCKPRPRKPKPPKISFNCEFCEEEFETKLELIQHIDTDHNNIEKRCDKCDYTSSSSGKLRRHLKTHNDDEIEERQCADCGETFTKQSILNEHIENEHVDKKTKFYRITVKHASKREVPDTSI